MQNAPSELAVKCNNVGSELSGPCSFTRKHLAPFRLAIACRLDAGSVPREISVQAKPALKNGNERFAVFPTSLVPR
jgi:hypothetical protein